MRTPVCTQLVETCKALPQDVQELPPALLTSRSVFVCAVLSQEAKCMNEVKFQLKLASNLQQIINMQTYAGRYTAHLTLAYSQIGPKGAAQVTSE